MFKRDYNTLLNEILTEYQNMTAEKITQGSVLYIKAAALASMLWGLYQSLDRAARQAFVTTADRENKIRHAAEYGIPVTDNMTDSEIADAVLTVRHNKLAGGNRYDYEAWAREVTHGEEPNIETVVKAKVHPLARGEGTFDIVIEWSSFFKRLTNPGNPNACPPQLIKKIEDIIQERRPVGSGFSWGVRVVPVTQQLFEPSIKYYGDANEDVAKRQIAEYIMSLDYDMPVARGAISRIMFESGADYVEILTPSNDTFKPWSDPISGQYTKFYSEPRWVHLIKGA